MARRSSASIVTHNTRESEHPDRNALIEQYMPLVRSIVGMYARAGQRPQVDIEDLEAEGYLQLIKSIDGFVADGRIDLTARLTHHIKSAMTRFIQHEMRFWDGRTAWSEVFTSDGEPKV